MVSVERVRVRPAGDKVFGEILVHVSWTLPFEHVAAVKERTPPSSPVYPRVKQLEKSFE